MMTPIEKLKELRGELSRPKFAQKLGVEPYIIKNIEEEKQKTIPDDLALALEKEYNIPFKWWKTGIEEPTPPDDSPCTKCLGDNERLVNLIEYAVQNHFGLFCLILDEIKSNPDGLKKYFLDK